jgi:hypothetical protein
MLATIHTVGCWCLPTVIPKEVMAIVDVVVSCGRLESFQFYPGQCFLCRRPHLAVNSFAHLIGTYEMNLLL